MRGIRDWLASAKACTCDSNLYLHVIDFIDVLTEVKCDERCTCSDHLWCVMIPPSVDFGQLTRVRPRVTTDTLSHGR